MLSLGTVIALIKKLAPGNPAQIEEIEEELNQQKTAIQGLKGDTEGNFQNIVTTIKGKDYLNEVVTNGKYAWYDRASMSNLSECNVVEFDVTHVKKFKYSYTIQTPDYRGLYFVDKNGTYISGVQTKTEAQNVSVPNGAVKCYATIKTTDQIAVYEIIAGDPAVELLKSQATYTSRTFGGITYTWQDNNTKINIDGTRTGTSFTTMYSDATNFPEGMGAGKQCKVVFHAVNPSIKVAFLAYVNGQEGTIKTFDTGETIFTIPETWSGIAIRLMVTGSGAKVENETINCPEIRANFNSEGKYIDINKQQRKQKMRI